MGGSLLHEQLSAFEVEAALAAFYAEADGAEKPGEGWLLLADDDDDETTNRDCTILLRSAERVRYAQAIRHARHDASRARISDVLVEIANFILDLEEERIEEDAETADSFESLWDDLDELCREHGWDFGVKIDTAYECAWACEVRLTPEPNRHGQVDESRVFYAAGGGVPLDCFAEAANAALAWAEEEVG